MPVSREVRTLIVRSRVGCPVLFLAANDDAVVITTQAGIFFDLSKLGYDVSGPATLKAITQVLESEQWGGGNDDRPQLDRGQHDLPHRHMVGKVDDDAVASANTLFAQEVGNLIGTPRHFCESQLYFGATVVDDPKRRLIISTSVGIKIIERPIECIELGPTEIAIGSFVIFTMVEQELACAQKCLQTLPCDPR